jgi:hypothetical protein
MGSRKLAEENASYLNDSSIICQLGSIRQVRQLTSLGLVSSSAKQE